MNERERRQRTVERSARANSVDIRHYSDSRRIHKRGGIRASLSLRVPFRWTGTLWHWYHTGRGTQMKDKLTDWASKNALTLAFILGLFIVTWVWIFIAVVFFGSSLSGS